MDDKKGCPFCGGTNLGPDFHRNQGHGDSGYDSLRIVCVDCKATRGSTDWGMPTEEAIQEAWKVWNKRAVIKWGDK